MKKKAALLLAAALILSTATVHEVWADTEEGEELSLEEAAPGFSDELDIQALDLADEVAQFGGYPEAYGEGEDEGNAFAAADNSLGSIIEEALRDGKEQLDVAAYKSDTETVKRSIIRVINDNPDLFNMEGADVDINEEDDTVSAVRFSYASDAKRKSSKYDKEVKKIMSGIKKDWDDEVKLMYLHDWLVTNCRYDLSYSRYTAYDAIVDHTAVCQGYSLAYMDLVKKAGLSAYLVSGRSMNHAWNLVKLDGRKYYVDCTWDDPITADYKGHFYKMYCRHDNFLCSQSQMKNENRHTGTDWSCDGERIYDKYDNKEYDEAPWKKAQRTPVAILDDGTYVYTGTATKYSGYSAYEYDPETGSETEYEGEYEYESNVAVAGGKVYISNSSSLYRLDRPEGKQIFVYELTASEKKKGSIYGIEGVGGKIRYDIGKDYRYENFVRSGYYDTSKEVKVKKITLDKTSIAFGEVGEAATLTATVTPAGAAVRWSSADPYVASVENGKVKATGKGETVITASADNKSVECTVTVGTVIRLDPKELIMFPGETAKLTPTVISPGPDTRNGFWWFSFDDDVLTVDDDGTVHALSSGKTYVEVQGYGGYAFCNVTVKDNEPDKPENLTAENTDKGTDVRWDPVYGATGYYITRKDGSSGYTDIATVTSASYSDNTATSEGKKYSYKVRAFRTVGENTYIGDISSSCVIYRLSPVAIKSVKNKDSKSFTVTWKKNSKCTGYEIQYSTDKKFGNAKSVTVKTRSTVSKKIKDLKKKKTYYVRIRPYKKAKNIKYYGVWKTYKKGVKVKK